MLYDILPSDNHEIYAGMSDEQKKAMLPPNPEALKEFLKDGKPAEKDDPKDCVVDGIYVRPLRDYRVLLGAEREKQVLLTDTIATALKDQKLVEDALAEGRKQEEACKKEIDTSKNDLANVGRESDDVAAYLKALEDALASTQTTITNFIETNKAMASQIAKYQLEAARLH